MLETLSLGGRRVIDVGCGDGVWTRFMAAQGAVVTGVECSPRQLAKARAAAPVPGATIVEGVAEALPAGDGSADIVTFMNSLHHVPVAVHERAMAEAARTLMPGGWLYAAEPVAEGTHFEAVRPIDDETAVRAQALVTLRSAERHGLVMEREVFYLHTVVHRDFETFRERIVSANAERERLFLDQDAAMRALFARLARPCDGGYAFDQPMRVNLLARR